MPPLQLESCVPWKQNTDVKKNVFSTVKNTYKENKGFTYKNSKSEARIKNVPKVKTTIEKVDKTKDIATKTLEKSSENNYPTPKNPKTIKTDTSTVKPVERKTVPQTIPKTTKNASDKSESTKTVSAEENETFTIQDKNVTFTVMHFKSTNKIFCIKELSGNFSLCRYKDPRLDSGWKKDFFKDETSGRNHNITKTTNKSDPEPQVLPKIVRTNIKDEKDDSVVGIKKTSVGDDSNSQKKTIIAKKDFKTIEKITNDTTLSKKTPLDKSKSQKSLKKTKTVSKMPKENKHQATSTYKVNEKMKTKRSKRFVLKNKNRRAYEGVFKRAERRERRRENGNGSS